MTRVSICVRSSHSFRNTRKPNYLLNRSVWEALIVFSKTLQKNYLWHGAASVWGTLILFSRQENKLPLTQVSICVRSSYSFLKTRQTNYLWHGSASVCRSSHSLIEDTTNKLSLTQVSICLRSSYGFLRDTTTKLPLTWAASVWGALILFSKTWCGISDLLINHVFQSEHIIYHDCFEPCECLTSKYIVWDFLVLEKTQILCLLHLHEVTQFLRGGKPASKTAFKYFLVQMYNLCTSRKTRITCGQHLCEELS